MLSQRALAPTKLAARFKPLPAVSLLTQTLRHATTTQTAPTAPARQLSTTPSALSGFSRGPPRFQTGPPSGFLSHLWAAVPDGAKTAVAVVGGCATLMVLGPLFFFVAPPLFVGGFFLMTRRLRKREKEMSKRWQALEGTRLVYDGSSSDLEGLEKFVKQRVVDAVETNENGIVGSLGIGSDLKFFLTDAESVDQDIRVSRDIRGGGALRAISVVSFGLMDRGTNKKFTRVGTILVTLKPQIYQNLTQFHGQAQDCVIEVIPLMPFKKPVVFDTPSEGHWGSSGRTFDIRAKRTRRTQ